MQNKIIIEGGRMKMSIMLVLMILSIGQAQALVSTVTDYINSLKAVAAYPDKAEAIYLRKDALGPNCSIRKLFNGRYVVKDNRNYTVVITDHPTLPLIHTVHGNWTSTERIEAAGGAASNGPTFVRQISNFRRASLAGYSSAKQRFVNYVNQYLLVNSNPCGATTAHFQSSISKTFEAISLSDVEFFKNTTTKTISCRTKAYSRAIRQPYPQCNFTQAYQWLPERKCKQLKNFYEKTAAVSLTNQSTLSATAAVSPITFQPITAAIATEMAMARLPANLEANNLIAEAATPVTSFEMAPPSVLEALEYEKEEITAAYVGVNAAVATKLAEAHKFLVAATAAGSTSVQIPADHSALLTHINTNLASVVTASNALPAVSINSAAFLAPRTAHLALVDAQISQVHVASGLTALANPVFAVTGRCPLVLPTLSVAPVQHQASAL